MSDNFREVNYAMLMALSIMLLFSSKACSIEKQAGPATMQKKIEVPESVYVVIKEEMERIQRICQPGIAKPLYDIYLEDLIALGKEKGTRGIISRIVSDPNHKWIVPLMAGKDVISWAEIGRDDKRQWVWISEYPIDTSIFSYDSTFITPQGAAFLEITKLWPANAYHPIFIFTFGMNLLLFHIPELGNNNLTLVCTTNNEMCETNGGCAEIGLLNKLQAKNSQSPSSMDAKSEQKLISNMRLGKGLSASALKKAKTHDEALQCLQLIENRINPH